MSTEVSASETTPLRRPESRNSETLTASPASAQPSPRHGVVVAQPAVDLHSDTVVVSQHYNVGSNYNHYSNNNRNNNNNNNNNNSETPIIVVTPSMIRMDTNKRILCRVGLDILILICVAFPILLFYLFGESYKRGFFCDDESLQHPFKDSTVRNWMLYVIGVVIPVTTMLTVEIIKSRYQAKHSNGNFSGRRYAFMDVQIPDWLVESYKRIGVFAFGAGACQLTTDIAKYSIGRLRPHFFAVCQPIMPDGTRCDDAINHGRYIESFRCEGVGSTARMLKDMSLSFPSGHSSFAFFSMVYLALYLQARMHWRGSMLLRHLLQFLLIMIAWYTALSRVSDYKHHWSDVLAGVAIGTLIAVIVRLCTPADWFDWNTVWPPAHMKSH